MAKMNAIIITMVLLDVFCYPSTTSGGASMNLVVDVDVDINVNNNQLLEPAAIFEGLDLSVSVSNATQNCSTNDYTNGTICACGKAMEASCSKFRGANNNACVACVDAVTFRGEICSQTYRENFCGACSPEFDFEWIDEIPLISQESEFVNVKILRGICEGNPVQNVTKVDPKVMEWLPFLQIFGCDIAFMGGLLNGLGFNLTKFHDSNGTETESQLGDVFHVDTLGYVIHCCQDPTFHGEGITCQSEDKFIWDVLRKATGCKRSVLIAELEGVGFEITELTSQHYGESYDVDLIQVSSLFKPALTLVLKQIYGLTIRTMLGLSIAAAARHGCGGSWFVPGADNLFASTFAMQSDFYFPSNIPSPYESTGTCGKSLTSEQTRLSVCSKVTTYLYDNAHLSGMSTLACSVDCTASRLDGISGSFVSVVIGVVELDTNISGLSKKQHGISNAVSSLNAQGLNITNDVFSTVGIGFRFGSKQYSSDDMIRSVNWNASEGQSDINFTISAMTPNMTEAMIAFKDSHHYKPSTPSNSKSNSTTIILAALLPSVALVGVVIGLVLRQNKSVTPADAEVFDVSAITINQRYESDRVDDNSDQHDTYSTA